jgi:hypothetical protein
MKLVDDWTKFYSWFSVQANAVGSAMAIGYASMYEQLKENFPPKYMMAITAIVFILGIIGRVVSQQPKDKP